MLTPEILHHQPIRKMPTSWSGTLWPLTLPLKTFSWKPRGVQVFWAGLLLTNFFFLSQRRKVKPSAPFTHLLGNSLLHLEQSTRRKYYSNKDSVNLDFWTLTSELMGLFYLAPGLSLLLHIYLLSFLISDHYSLHSWESQLHFLLQSWSYGVF